MTCAEIVLERSIEKLQGKRCNRGGKMKVVTRNPNAITRYVMNFEEKAQKVRDDELELTENDGELHENIDSDSEYYKYVTASGKGEWYLTAGLGNCGEALIFGGRRTSFQNGSSFLGWEPKRTDGWAVLKSTHSDRGPFETKVSFYKRKYHDWVNCKPEHIRIVEIGDSGATQLKREYPQSTAIAEEIALDQNYRVATVIFDVRDIDIKWLNEKLQDELIDGKVEE